MPWTAESFKARHWKDASPKQAATAAEQANAMIKNGVAEGTAIAVSIKHAKSPKRRHAVMDSHGRHSILD